MATTTASPQTSRTAALFDSVGKAYQTAFLDVPAQQRSLHRLISNLPPAANVLDIGCGTGLPASGMLASAGFAVTGIDVSPEMLKVARQQVPAAKAFIQADARTWEPAAGDASFDAIVVYFSFISGVTFADTHELFRRTYRWLKPGGYLIFATVPFGLENVETKWMGRSAVCSSLSVEDNLQSITAAGFQIVKHDVEKFMPKGVEAGLCTAEEVWEEEHVFVYAKKS